MLLVRRCLTYFVGYRPLETLRAVGLELDVVPLHRIPNLIQVRLPHGGPVDAIDHESVGLHPLFFQAIGKE